MKVCPTGASHKLEDGTVQIDKSKCIGCQFCAMACPYGVRYLNEEERVVEKCTLCEQITAQGGLPQCVIQCGGRARFFGDLDEGIDSFEAPEIGRRRRSYDNLYTGRVKLGDMAKEYRGRRVPPARCGQRPALRLHPARPRLEGWGIMELQWPLILFTTLLAWAAGLFAAQCLWALRGKGGRAQMPALIAERAFWSWEASRCSSTWSTGSASSTASGT